MNDEVTNSGEDVEVVSHASLDRLEAASCADRTSVGSRRSCILAGGVRCDVEACARAGVPLAFGTDELLFGFAEERELELYVEAGIPAGDALYDATLGASRIMRRDNDLGSIVPGKIADLVLIDGDPPRQYLRGAPADAGMQER